MSDIREDNGQERPEVINEVRVKQGRRGTQVLIILVCSLALAVVAARFLGRI